MTPLPESVIHEGLELAEKATERPWMIHAADEADSLFSVAGPPKRNKNRDKVAVFPVMQSDKIRRSNAAYITHAANHYEALAREVLELRQRVAKLTEERDRLRERLTETTTH